MSCKKKKFILYSTFLFYTHQNSDVILASGLCVDNASDCQTHVRYCRAPNAIAFMMSRCPMTCGYCAPENNHLFTSFNLVYNCLSDQSEVLS